MMKANICGRVIFLAALCCAACGAAPGQDARKPDPEAPARAGPAAPPTLEALKAAGALRSSYLKRERRPAGAEAPKPQLAAFRKSIEPVLRKACFQCHGPDTQEGNVRIDTLDPDLLHGDDVDWWLEIAAVLNNGEMPPADEAELTDDERSAVVEWLASEIQAASAVRRAEQGHSTFRRMTRYEHNYALQDLLGLPSDFARDLPPESTSEDGFQNSSEMLHMSAIQLEVYRELSRNALRRATVRGERPTPLSWSVAMEAAAAAEWEKQDEQLKQIRKKFQDEPERLKQELERQAASFRARPNGAHYKNLATGQTAQATWSYPGAKHAWEPSRSQPEAPHVSQQVAIIPPRHGLIVELGDQVPDEGTLRVRVRASRTSAEDNRIPSLQLTFGWQASNDSQATVRISDRDIAIDAAPGQPAFYQWDVLLSEIYPRNSVRKTSKMGELPSPSEYVKLVNSSVSDGDIQLDYVEITAPVYPRWPPESHTRIFIDSEQRADEPAYAREVLATFMARAWRRDVTATEVDQKLALFARIRPECESFEEAAIEVLVSVLASPKFLYLARSGPSIEAGENTAGENTAGENTADENTADKNTGGKITGGENSGEHTAAEPLSDYELATRLSIFLWCSVPDQELLDLAAKGGLRQPEALAGQVKRLLEDPRSRRFSKHFVRQWLGMQLLDFLNVDRKAYPQFDSTLKEAMQEEPVAFFQEVLDHNGSVLDFLDADYTVANERLARHYGLSDVYGNHFRRVPLDLQSRRGGLLTQAGLLAMNSDGKDSHPLKRGIWLLKSLLNAPPPPPPPAVPEIDLADPEIAKLTLKQRIENHRNHAACMSCHAKIDPWGIAFENFDAVGSWRTEIQGKPVDATSLLFNKQRLEGMDGLKRFLLESRQDQFARALADKMTTYALGRPLTFGDRSSVDQITADLRQRGDGLATLVTLIVASELFQSK